MDRELEAVRRALAAVGERGRTERLPDGARRVVGDYVRSAREAGLSWAELAKRTKLAVNTLRRIGAERPRRQWPPPARLVPVEVVADLDDRGDDRDDRRLTLLTPQGWRLEGLTVASAAELLRRLAS